MPPLRRESLAPDPFEQFSDWYELANAEVPLVDAICIATVDQFGMPDARMVLLKGHGPDGFRFYTNRESAKGAQLDAHPAAAMVAYWRELDRQVRARGRVKALSDEESDAYFATRPRDSQLGAWASEQSRPLASREELDQRVAELEAQLADREVPRPSQWGGYLLVPNSIEFWQGQVGRLHDRFTYTRSNGGWEIERLAP
jgi:pyridoxamine 5'-phosphate oxidase